MFTRPGITGTVQMRVIVTDRPTPPMRDSWNRQQLGPYGMGFPSLDVYAWDDELRALGFERAVPEVRAVAFHPGGAPIGRGVSVRSGGPLAA